MISIRKSWNSEKQWRNYFFIISLVVVLATSFFLDRWIIKIFDYLESPLIASFFSYITYLGNPIFLTIIVVIIMLISENRNKTYFALFSIFVTISFTLVLKSLIARHRPEEIVISQINFLNFSFPSMHTAVSFGIIPLLNKSFPRARWLFWISASLVFISRIYLKMHYFSDVIFGAVLGYITGSMMLNFYDAEFISNPSRFARQIFHAVIGIILAVMIYLGVISNLILVILIIGGLLLSFLCLRVNPPIIYWFLERLERKDELKRFPGKGAITFLVGALIANMFFRKDVAAASLMILALGDPVSHIIGIYYGKTKTVFGKRKFLEGTFFGILTGFVGAIFFVSPIEALIASILAMSVEAMEIKIGLIDFDDNMIIPVVSGVAIMIIRNVL